MTFFRTAAAVLGAAMLGGCAIRPLQEDVTGIQTEDIVKSIRCEMRLAIADKAAALFDVAAQTKAEVGDIAGADRSARLAIDIRSHAHELSEAIVYKLNPDEKRFYLKYINIGIAYIFRFDISEENKVSLAADPLRLISRGTVGVTLAGSSDLKRQSIRRFAVAETFGEVLFDKKLRCDPVNRAANFNFPISGTIGMDRAINTFINLNEGRDLAAFEGTRIFADTLTFTTTVGASSKPYIILNAVGRQVGFDKTSILPEATRTDVHEVIIGMSKAETPAPKPAASKAARKADPAQPRFAIPFTLPRSPAAGASAKEKALDNAYQQSILNFYDRLGTLPR